MSVYFYPNRCIRIVVTLLMAAGILVNTFASQVQPAAAATGLTVSIIAAPNLIVDSNVLSPSTEQPIVATVIGKFCNTSGSTINNVWGYIGDGTTPGAYPKTANNPTFFDATVSTTYQGQYSFTHLGNTVDASRYIGSLAAGECSYQYWSFTYPKTAINNANGLTIPAWGTSVKPGDDMKLSFNIWGNFTGSVGGPTVATHTATLRNEISAMANKIEPNGNPGGTWFNTDTSTVLPGQTVITNGILYRLGNVNKGFDNDANGTPDYNAWLQPFGNPAYDPNCFRLIKTSGVVTATTTSGDVIIPFTNNLYFTDLPSNNTNVVGLVYYEFLALGGSCTIPISPYQEAASGSDNEKFNGDYGAGPAPVGTLKPAVTLIKSGNPPSLRETEMVTYRMPFANTGGATAGLTLSVGGIDMPLVVEDTVPNGMQYVCGSATAQTTLVAPNTVTMYYSVDSGLNWTTTEPASCPGTNPTSTGPNGLIVIRWKLNNPLPKSSDAGSSGNIAGFQAIVPSAFTATHDPFIENCANGKFGTSGSSFVQACATTIVKGNNSIGDFIWKDADGDGNQDGGVNEPGLSGVTVKLYYDKNANGTVDTGELQVNAVTMNIVDGYLDYDGDGITNGDTGDTGEFDIYNVINGQIDVNGDNSITPADAGTALVGGYNVINGYIDVDGDGSTTFPDTGDDGTANGTTTQSKSATITNGNVTVTSGPTATFAGYTLIGGQLDVNGDGVISALDTGTGLIGGFNSSTNTVVLYDVASGNVQSGAVNVASASLIGTYGFAYLPSKSYIVQVNATDTDITTGYTPTTRKTYSVNLGAGGVNNRTSDFGFGPTLSLDKHLDTLDPAVVGETVTFHIDLKNLLPGDGTAQGYCQYNVWSTAAGTHTGTTGWQNRAGAYDAATGPNGALAYINPASNSDIIAASSFGLNLPSGVSIRKVEAIYSVYVDGAFVDDHLQALYWRGATQQTTGDLPMATINAFGPGGSKQAIYAWDVTNVPAGTTWNTSDFNGTAVEVGFLTQKSGGSTGDTNLRLDAMGFRVTTDQICGGADSTITVLPLTDTYDSDKLDFVSADPPESSRSVVGSVGTINWTNVATLYAGGLKTVVLNFRAKATTSTATVDTATSANAKFATGRAVNTPVSDTGSVNINASGSIAGRVWANNDTSGGSAWVNPNGYNGTDTFISNTTLNLYGCYNPTTNYLVTTPTSASKDCEDTSQNNYEWRLVATTQSAADGTYSFGGLRDGYYNVMLNSTTLPTNFTTCVAQAGPAGNGAGVTSCVASGGNNYWNSPTANMNTFNNLVNGGAGENVTNVNFGYVDGGGTTNQGAITGYVWNDRDAGGYSGGNPDWDTTATPPERGILGVRVDLCTDTTCAAPVQTATTDSNGFFSFGNVPTGTTYYVKVRVADLPGMSQTGDPDVTTAACSGGTCDSITAVTVAANQVVGPKYFGYTGGLTIGDTVYTDWNGNGVQGDGNSLNGNEGEPGIDGVQVTLYRDLGTVGTYEPGVDVFIETKTTASGGQYSFSGLPGNLNDYIVVVASATIPAGYIQTGDPEGGCTSGATCDGRDFIPDIGSSSYALADFGYQPRGTAELGDYVWFDADGDSAQDSGEVGAANVTLNLYHDTNGDGLITSGSDALIATTDTSSYSVVDGCVDIDGDGVTCSDTDDNLTAGNALQGTKVYYGRLDVDGDGRATYRVMNSLIDIDGSGTVDATDNLPSLYGKRVIGGRLDMDGSGTITAADTGTYLGYTVRANGYLDINGDNTANDNSFTAIPDDGDNGYFGPYRVITGYLDWNNDGSATTTDDGSLKGFYLFKNLAATSGSDAYIVQVASAEFTTGGDLIGYGMTNSSTGYNGSQRSYKTTLTASQQLYTADLGFATTQIGDFIWADYNGDGLAGTNEPGINGVVVELYNDVDNSGTLNGGDTLYGTTTTADKLVGGVNKPGYYLFSGAPAGNYIIKVADSNFSSGVLASYRLTADPDIYNLTNPDSVSCLTAGAVGCDSIKPFDRYASGATVNGRLMDENPAIRGGSNEMTADFGYQPTAYVGDTLWIDLDADGVRDASEPGIPYVTVRLCADSGCGTVQATTTTDENGEYSFGGAVLTAGVHYIVVSTGTLPSGLTQTYDPVTGNNCNAGTCTAAPSITINLGRTDGVVSAIGANACAAGVNCNLNVDFGYRFYGPESVNGTVWFDTDGGGQTGGVGDIDANEPVRYANVPIYLWRCVNACGGTDDILLGSDLTDSSGKYDFSGLASGSYRIYINDNVPTLDGLTITTHGSYPYYYDVTLSGTTLTRDYGFRATSGISNVGNFVWTDSDNDGVQDVGEPGVPGVIVELRGSGGYLLATTTTDASGAYSFPVVVTSATSYYLAYVSPTFTLQDQGGNDLTDSDANPATGRTITFTVNPSTDDLTRDAGLPPVRTVIGNSIWLDEDGNGYQDAGEAGIPNATVQLWDSTHTALLATTTTDANGNYIFANLLPATYQIDVSSVPTGLVPSTIIGGTADFTNKAEPLTVVAASGSENLYADFGYNYAPSTDTDGNIGTGAIGDRLWIDDGDGVQEPGEPGLSGITVDLLTPGPDGILGTSDDVVAATTTSDPDGSYIFDGLSAGSYVVRVNGGSTPTNYTLTGDPDLFGALCTTCDNRTTTPILLAPGDIFVNADFGYTPTASNGGSIGDTLWLDVDRDNVDDGAASEPRLSGVTVALIRDLNGNGSWESGEPIIASDITDVNGTYLFTNVPVTDGVGTDDYLVWVNDTENVLFGLSPVYDSNGVGTPNISAATDLTDAGNLAQDFAYAPTGHDVGEGLIGDTIFYDNSGDGIYQTGEGIEGVRVNLYRDVNNNNIWDSGDIMLNTTFSSETGAYYFGGLAAGEYVVRIDTSTLPTGVTNTVDPDTASPGDSQSAVTLAASGINLAQDFGYRDTSTPNSISGTLWKDTNADGVLDAGETGRFDGVTIVLRNSSGNIVAATTTSGGGNYSFNNLPDGTFTVDVSDDANLLNGSWHSLGTADSNNNSQVDPYTVTVMGGQNNDTGDFGYYRDPAVIGNFVWNDTDNDGIQDGGELGIPNIEVILTVTWPGGVGTTVITTRTDASGFYTFGNLLADEDFNGIGGGEPTFQLTFNHPTLYAPSPLNQGADDTVDSDGTSLAVSPQEGTTNNTYDSGLAPQAGAIGNSVWLDEDGNGYQDAGEAGIPNATVQLWDSTHTTLIASTVTDANGNYIFRDVAPGTYQVDVSSVPAGLVPSTVIVGTADFTNKANPYTVVVTAGGESLYADFGYNYAPPTDTGGNTGTGAIGDRLWIDDGDGVQEPGEPGLSGITVDLLTPGSDGILGTSDDVVAATTTSAADGTYIFDGLAAGSYVVRVNGGSTPTNYTLTGDPDLLGAPCTTCDNRTTTPILLAPGDVFVNADFGYTPTAGNGGSIGDTLWLDVDRDSTLDAGEPLLAGVTVALIRDLNGNGSWDSGEPIIASDITDVNGTYLFTNVPVTDGVGTDDYLVWVNDTESVLYGLFPTYDSNGVVTPNISAVVDLAPAGNLAQDFAYAPYGHAGGNGLIGDTIFYDNNGDGTYQTGEGMEGIRVNLYDSTGTVLLATTTSSENGQYFFGGLAAGTYIVRVDTATLPAGVTNTIDPDGATLNESTVVLAAGGINLAQDFGYRDTSTPNSISGTLWKDTNADGILDAGETGRFDLVTIVLRNSSGNIVATATTSGGGNYSFPNLPDGTFTVDVSDDANLLHGYWHSLGGTPGADNNSQVDPYTVTVSGGQVNTTGDFGYYRDPASIGNFVWLDRDNDGVQDSGEPGIQGITVTLTINYPNLTVVNLSTRTLALGVYSFGNLLLDENFNQANTSTSYPIYTISVAALPGLNASPEALASNNDQVDGDSDGANEIATVLKGETDPAYDFGFYTLRLDLGDLPDTYRTYFSPGPANVIFPDSNADGAPESAGGIPAVWLGTIVDVESDGKPDANARGDDGLGQDDEDGVAFVSGNWKPNTNATLNVTINGSASGVRVHYGVWIDWNDDDILDTFLTGSAVTGSPVIVPVTVLVPGSYVATSPVYFRVRASDQPLTSADYQGTIVNGETEDYYTTFTPTAVKLVEARATPLLPPSWLLIAAAMLLLVSLTGVAALALQRRRIH